MRLPNPFQPRADYGRLGTSARQIEATGPVTVMTDAHFDNLRDGQVDSLLALAAGGETVLIQHGGRLVALGEWIRLRAH